MRTGILAALVVAMSPGLVTAKERLLVLQLGALRGIDVELTGITEDLLITRLHAIGMHEVSSWKELSKMMDLEVQKQLTGCTDDTCLAEVGGALGARWLVSGKLSQLGEGAIMNLTLMDTQEAKLAGQVTANVPEDEDDLVEEVRVAAYQLLNLPVPALPPPPWYKNPWFWGGAAVVVGALGTVLYITSRPEKAPDSPLGQLVLDAN